MSSTSSLSRGECRYISLDEIKDATDNFNKSNLLGHGGEGNVYLAKIKLDCETAQVAVKHLKPNSEEFDMEIKTVSKLQHPNLVSLLGYCDESGQKILLYEYMEKGSLSDYVMKKSSTSLSWLQRLGICLDAARGLQYLHIATDEFPKGIIHRDVKPDNILLGKDWVAKISDFGMFELSHAGQVKSTMITNLKGTGGYYAPEYIAYNAITRKIDVYAFGVVLFQVLCLKMPWDRGDESYYRKDDEDLGIWAQQNVDAKIKAEISDDSLMTFTAIIGNALKKDPAKRPTMDDVVLELEKVLKCQEHGGEPRKAQAARDPDKHSTSGSLRRFKRHSRACPNFQLDELEKATNNFDDAKIIVRGEFGITYEALLDDGQMVAVKCYNIDEDIADEFCNKIDMVYKLLHPSLVRLIGVCNDSKSQELILVHEFMKGGTLADHLFGEGVPLSWVQRLQICSCVANGLTYIHHRISNTKLNVHRNVNSANILIDEFWTAKISEFGFSKLGNANAKNSAKYLDPYYNLTGEQQWRSDVYAFGVVLLDILFGSKNFNGGMEEKQDKLGQWIQQCLKDGSLEWIIDEQLKGKIPHECLKEFAELASSCLDDNPMSRPTMIEVEQKLLLNFKNYLTMQP